MDSIQAGNILRVQKTHFGMEELSIALIIEVNKDKQFARYLYILDSTWPITTIGTDNFDKFSPLTMISDYEVRRLEENLEKLEMVKQAILTLRGMKKHD